MIPVRIHFFSCSKSHWSLALAVKSFMLSYHILEVTESGLGDIDRSFPAPSLMAKCGPASFMIGNDHNVMEVLHA
jgi:hypothetical protein